MPSANKTPNYNLTQYSNNGSDKISALQDYNEDMSKIDTALNSNATAIITKADKATTYSKTDVDTKISANTDSLTELRNKYNDSMQTIDSKFKTVSDDVLIARNNIQANTDALSIIPSQKLHYFHHAVFIGDSWTFGYGVEASQRWSTALCAMLGLTEHNYAMTGAGYVYKSVDGSTTFVDEANTAAQDTSFNHDDVEFIIIYGGLNDRTHGSAYEDIGTALSTMLQTLRTAYPTTRIYVCGFNDMQGSYWDRYTYQIASAIKNGCTGTGVSYIECPSANFIEDATTYESVNTGHPNAVGHAAILDRILNGLSIGGGTPIFRPFNHTIKMFDSVLPDSENNTNITEATRIKSNGGNLLQVDTTLSGSYILDSTNAYAIATQGESTNTAISSMNTSPRGTLPTSIFPMFCYAYDAVSYNWVPCTIYQQINAQTQKREVVLRPNGLTKSATNKYGFTSLKISQTFDGPWGNLF